MVAMVDERRMRSQWRRVCVDRSGRKKRVGYIIIGRKRRAAAGAWGTVACVLSRFGDRSSSSLSLWLSDACRDAAKEVRVACVSRGAMVQVKTVMMNERRQLVAGKRTCF